MFEKKHPDTKKLRTPEDFFKQEKWREAVALLQNSGIWVVLRYLVVDLIRLGVNIVQSEMVEFRGEGVCSVV